MPVQTIEAAIEQIVAASEQAGVEVLGLESTFGRVLAADVRADRDSPPFAKSMMDGFAVRAESVAAGTPVSVVGEIAAGGSADLDVPSGCAIRIMTGAPVPGSVDTVIPVELASVDSEGRVAFERMPSTGANVLAQGSIAEAGDAILSSGVVLDAGRVAALAEFGVSKVSVAKRLTVAILATGDELVDFDQEPGPGQIRNSNGPMLSALMRSLGCEVVSVGVARDNVDDLDRAIGAGLEADILLLSGGVSAGLYDLVPDRLAAAGVEEVFHKVAIKPGKPIWFGRRGRNLVFGLPGNPVSSLVCGLVFVSPAIERMTGAAEPVLRTISATLSQSHRQKGDRTTYWPSNLSFTDDGPAVDPLPWKGSADLVAVANANCWAIFPPGDRHFGIGERVQVVLHCGRGPV